MLPLNEVEGSNTAQIITQRPDLFCIVMPINVNHFEIFLSDPPAITMLAGNFQEGLLMPRQHQPSGNGSQSIKACLSALPNTLTKLNVHK